LQGHVSPPPCLEGPHANTNGLLLRRDFHTLFDRGYITVDKSLAVEVSHRIKEDFGNGKEYYAHHGRKLIILPERREHMPDPRYLEWHNENVYLGNIRSLLKTFLFKRFPEVSLICPFF
jgi:putative restriction endonuclease